MSYLVVRDAEGTVVAFGPNDANYLPQVAAGQTRAVEGSQPTLPSGPDRRGFEGALFAAKNFDMLAVEALYKEHPMFARFLQDENWAFMQGYLITKHGDGLLTDVDYAIIKTAAAPNHIPIELP